MLRRMKIRTLLLCVLGVLGGGYGLLLGTVYLSTTATHRRISQISSSLFPAALKIEASEAAFEKMKKHYGDAVVLQDAKALSGAESDAEAIAEGLAQVREALAHSPELRGQADALAGQFADLRTRDRETYTALLSNPAGASDELMGRVGDLGKENVALTQSMGALDKAIAQAFQKQLDGVDAWSVRSRLTGLVMLAFIVVSGGFAWWMTQSRIVAPLRMLEGHMGRVAEGDLRERIPVASEDEIGELSRWFNTFLDKMQALIRQVQENTKRLAAACEGISSSSSEMAHGAESQQMQTAQVASAMQEMSATVQEISRNSTAAAEQAHGGAAAAREGGAAMERTIGMMQRVTSSVEDVARQIVELGNRSDQIGRIVGVIDEIAQQTNLLALNAAIESARAGEHGRGFAVVAGEVRRLAERTTSATKEIAAMIGSIQNDTKAAVEAMGRGTEEVEEGVRTAQEAGAKLQGIIHGAEQAAASVAQIATAATEQASTTDEVSGNITEIATISNRVASGASESARSSGELTRLAEELDSLMARFRVEDSDGGAGLQAGIPAGRGEAVLRARAGAAIAV